eukprot:scaffold94895_cov45-Phaeocystis_antarctica.AAC.1
MLAPGSSRDRLELGVGVRVREDVCARLVEQHEAAAAVRLLRGELGLGVRARARARVRVRVAVSAPLPLARAHSTAGARRRRTCPPG